MTSRQLRLVRAAAVSSVATLVAAVSHTFGGGAAPHPLLVLAVITLLVPIAAVLVGVRPSRVRVASTVLLAQGVFHLVFQALGSPTGADIIGGAGHAHHGTLPALESVPVAASIAASIDVSMLAAHLLAAALTALAVLPGETLVRAVAGWVLLLLRRGVCAAPSEHPRPSALKSLLLPARDTAVSAAVSRRGPPALLGG